MTLRIENAGAVRTLVMDRPEAMNALSADQVERMLDAVAQAAEDRVAVLAFRGEGRAFCAGFDLSDLEQVDDAQLLYRIVRVELLLQAVGNSPCLTVALAHGSAMGAGADLFAACQWRVAAEGTRFRMPGLAFGIVLGTRRLGALIGRERARELQQALRPFDAAQAVSFNFASRIAEASQWTAVLEEAGGIAATLPPETRARLMRALSDDIDDLSLADIVRSAAVPGLKQRMLAFRQQQIGARRRAATNDANER